MQDLLTALIEVLTVVSVLFLAIDFITGLQRIAQPTAQLRSKPQTEPGILAQSTEVVTPANEMLDPSAELPDPWTLPVDEVPHCAHKSELAPNIQLPPIEPVVVLRLLPPTSSASCGQPPALPVTVKMALDELLADIELDKLQLRPARKIAKLLNIPQKLNSKDKPLSFIRGQIKAKLQQLEEVPAETLEEMKRELRAS